MTGTAMVAGRLYGQTRTRKASWFWVPELSVFRFSRSSSLFLFNASHRVPDYSGGDVLGNSSRVDTSTVCEALKYKLSFLTLLFLALGLSCHCLLFPGLSQAKGFGCVRAAVGKGRTEHNQGHRGFGPSSRPDRLSFLLDIIVPIVYLHLYCHILVV